MGRLSLSLSLSLLAAAAGLSLTGGSARLARTHPSRSPTRPYMTEDGGEVDPVATVMGSLYKPGVGRSISYGVLTREVDQSSVPTDAQREQMREAAAAQLVNISEQERLRRREAGIAFSIVTVLYAIGLLVAEASPAARLSLFPFAFFTTGFLGSAREGL